MNRFNVYNRLSHKWSDAFSHRDDWAFIAVAKATPFRETVQPRDFSDGGEQICLVELDREVRARVGKLALENTMGGSNCTHEWDCCGCARRHITAKKIGKRKFLVHQRITFNY